jgi:hypothetical protein
MKSAIILIALCVAAISAVSSDSQNFLSPMEHPQVQVLLERVKGTPLGRSIAALIKMKLALGAMGAKGKYDKLFDAFQAVEEFLNDQKEFEIKRWREVINRKTRQLSQAKADLKVNRENLADANGNLRSVNSEFASNAIAIG